MRAVALLAVRNEQRLIGACLDNLQRQGLYVYVIDNESADGTGDIAVAHPAVIGLETLAYPGMYSWEPILRRKEELAATLDGDWFMHVDADEIRLPPPGLATLREAFEAADASGANAVNFMEFTFVPVQEHPDHDHPDFQRTMRWYYPFLPRFPHRLNAWKRQPSRVDLTSRSGHRVQFPNLRMYEPSFPMRHYLFLSLEHAHEKYVRRRYDPADIARGWSRNRDRLEATDIRLPAASAMRTYVADDRLDGSEPRTSHDLVFRPRR